MKFYKNLYCSNNIITKKTKICRKLKRNIGQLNIYIILLGNGTNQLEIIHCAYLQQKYFDKKELFIVGIADGYFEAVLIVQRITEDVVNQTGEAYIKKYLVSQW